MEWTTENVSFHTPPCLKIAMGDTEEQMMNRKTSIKAW